MKFIISFLVLVNFVYANTSLVYKINKGKKELGYYSIDYKTKYISTKTYGAVNKIKFFVDKKINYINDGHRNIVFIKNKKKIEFDIETKLNLIDKKKQKKYRRNLKKVKGNEMLLITKKGKKNIELFNKRPTTIYTLEEVLNLALTKNIKPQNFVLFGKLGIMKMIAKIELTKDGFDIVNKSKNKKYLKVVVKNNIPTKIISYVSDWSMTIYLAGEPKKYKVDTKILQAKLKEILSKNFKDGISILDINGIKKTSKSYIVSYDLQVNYPSNTTDKKRYCIRSYKQYGKKLKKVVYHETNCQVKLKSKIKAKEVTKFFIEDLIKTYPQLKVTKKYKVSKKGTVMYMLIPTVK